METILLLLLTMTVCACVDHHTGGARLFRGEKNAKAAEDYQQNDGTVGYETWYWDKRLVPYTIFALYILGLSLYLNSWQAGVAKWALVVLTYFWFRSHSPREMFPAGNGATWKQNLKGILAGGLMGLIGFAPLSVRFFDNPWLIGTIALGGFIGLYHWFFRGNPLFRSYGELMEGALAVGIMAFLNVYF